MDSNKGFTLIELIITVAIVGILATIAYASYSDSIQKSRRTDAKDALLSAAAKQEQWYLQRNAYTNDITQIATGLSKEGYYTVAATHELNDVACADSTCFTLTATATGVQASDTNCLVFTVNNLGQRKSEDSGGTDTSSTCW